jgi:ribosomal protein S11
MSAQTKEIGMKPETIERWIKEAGIEASEVVMRGGQPMVWRSCYRCGGTGYVWAKHVEGGRCFACHTSKGRYVALKSLAAAARTQVKKAERAAKAAHDGIRRTVAEARTFLAATPGLARALTARTSITRKFARQLATRGSLSERQVEVAIEVAQREAHQATLTEIEVPEGRQMIEGTILKISEYENRFSYGGGSVWKMLVAVERNGERFRIFGSVPTAIHFDAERGTKVRFAATLEPKEKGFGFFKRPAKAEVVA